MHRENSELVVNWPYVGSIIAISAIALGFTAWALSTQGFSDLSPRWNLIAIVATDIACLAVFAGLIWKTYRDSRTPVTTEGVRRPGLWGDAFLRWSDVRGVRFVHFGIHLLGPAGRVVISPYAYRDPERLIERVRTLLRHAGHRV